MDITKIVQENNMTLEDVSKYVNFDCILTQRHKTFILEEMINDSEYTFGTNWVDIALSFDGVDERTEEGQRLIHQFHKACGNDFDYTVPWCASFVSYCLKESGVEGINPFSSLTSHFSTSDDYEKLEKPKKGCIIYWKNNNNSGGHVAFVIDDEFDGVSVNTIGGNQSAYDKSGSLSQVTIGSRKLDSSSRSFVGFYFPKKYTETQSATKKVDRNKFSKFVSIVQYTLNKSLYKRQRELLAEDGVFGNETYAALNDIKYREFCFYYHNIDKCKRLREFYKKGVR